LKERLGPLVLEVALKRGALPFARRRSKSRHTAYGDIQLLLKRRPSRIYARNPIADTVVLTFGSLRADGVFRRHLNLGRLEKSFA